MGTGNREAPYVYCIFNLFLYLPCVFDLFTWHRFGTLIDECALNPRYHSLYLTGRRIDDNFRFYLPAA